MNIRPLSVYKTSAVNFGYNSKYHKRVKKTLQKSNDSRAKFVLENEKQLMEIEDKVVQMEKEYKYDTQKYKDLTEYLIEFRPRVAYMIELIDGSLEYSDTLINTYFDEIYSSDIDKAVVWRESLCRKLNDYTLKDYFQNRLLLPKKQTGRIPKKIYKKLCLILCPRLINLTMMKN